jgi:hypothetical protein
MSKKRLLEKMASDRLVVKALSRSLGLAAFSAAD